MDRGAVGRGLVIAFVELAGDELFGRKCGDWLYGWVLFIFGGFRSRHGYSGAGYMGSSPHIPTISLAVRIRKRNQVQIVTLYNP